MANDRTSSDTSTPGKPLAAMGREENAIYQHDAIAARVLEPQVDTEANVIHFSEVYNSERLLLPDECEFRTYRILIRKIAYATTEEKQSLQKGRILRDVTAEILGHREQ